MSSPQQASLALDLQDSGLRQTPPGEASITSALPTVPRRSQSERRPHHISSYVLQSRDHDPPPRPPPEMSSDGRRDALIAIDRKRRLTASAQETGRRRTTTGGFTTRDNRYYPATPRRASNHSAGSLGNNMAEREIIDLTHSSLPAPSQAVQQPSLPMPRRRTPSNSSRGYVVPRWQPDGEVHECPICHRPFSFLFRRHHCRKCGRVVCNDCSPHRITIPRQYIVHPPGALEELLIPSDIAPIDLTTGDDDDDAAAAAEMPWSGRYRQPTSALGGGEKVRLCNPCVPDPQPELQPPSNDLSFMGGPEGSQRSAPPTLANFPPLHYAPSPNASRMRDGDHRVHGQLPPHPGTRVHLGTNGDDDDSSSDSNMYTSPSRRVFPGSFQPHFPPPPSAVAHTRYHSMDSRHGPLPPLPPFNHRLRPPPLFDPSRPQYGMSPGLQSGLMPRPPYPAPPQHAPRPPRPRVREEDMCPVCRAMLPPKGPDGDETDRESHIMACINRLDATASRPRASASDPPVPAQYSSSMPAPSATYGASGPSLPLASSSITPPPRTTTAMLRFTATEKDCTPQTKNEGALDTSAVECSICMVEYDVGDKLVRLECWCKFHEDCIVEWFGRKAECPVHRLT